MPGHYLSTLFTPNSIALFGASDRSDSVGGVVLRNLLNSDYPGKVFAINPKHDQVQGQTAYPCVTEVPEPIDLAVVATPAKTIPAIVKACGEHGIKMMLVLCAGFRETGALGRRLEEQLVQQAKLYGIRLVGPKSLGIIRPGKKLNMTFGHNNATPGDIALVSQSGTICSAILDWAEMNNVGFSAVISTGIGADLDFGDYLDYLASDPATKSILLYIEGIRDARRFMNSLRTAARIKPVIALKVGRHSASAEASMSHTGALVGSDETFSSALSRSGVLRVESVSQLFSAAKALSSPRHRTPAERLLIITNGGGPGVMAADRAADLNIPLSPLSDETIKALNQVLPEIWSHGNPVDIIGDASPERYRRAIETCLLDSNVDGAIILLTPQAMTCPTEVARTVIEVAQKSKKPLLTSWMGGQHVEEANELFNQASIPNFHTPNNAVEAFSFMSAYNKNQRLLLQTPSQLKLGFEQPDKEGANLIIESALNDHRHVLTEMESIAVLRAFNIPTVPIATACSANDALIIAETIGFPVAMKIHSTDINHKTDAGGVRLNIASGHEVRGAYRELTAQVAKNRPKAKILGVVVEKMYRNDNARELMVGIKHDPVFGPVISFGSGGTAVEVIGDVAIALPPLNYRLATDLIQRTKVYRLLGQFRHLPAANVEQLINLLLRVSNLACELPAVREMDINPLLIDEDGLIAVDARLRVDHPKRSADPYHHLAIHPYPTHLSSTVQLANGIDVTIRPVRPEDAEMEQDLIRGLSTESRYFRFMNTLQELTPEMLVRFTQIDYYEDMALIAVVENDDCEEEIGVARYTTNPDKKSCEFALVVSDKWQHKGIAHRLMHRLIEIARERGLEVMQGEILSDNFKMLDLIRSLGFRVENLPDDLSVKSACIDLI